MPVSDYAPLITVCGPILGAIVGAWTVTRVQSRSNTQNILARRVELLTDKQLITNRSLMHVVIAHPGYDLGSKDAFTDQGQQDVRAFHENTRDRIFGWYRALCDLEPDVLAYASDGVTAVYHKVQESWYTLSTAYNTTTVDKDSLLTPATPQALTEILRDSIRLNEHTFMGMRQLGHILVEAVRDETVSIRAGFVQLPQKKRWWGRQKP